MEPGLLADQHGRWRVGPRLTWTRPHIGMRVKPGRPRGCPTQGWHPNLGCRDEAVISVCEISSKFVLRI